MDLIICPNCKHEIEVSEVLAHQIEDQVRSQIDKKHKEELVLAKQSAVDESSKKIKQQFELQITQAKEESSANQARNKELLEQVTELTKSMRQLKTEKDEVKLDMEKKLASEEEKIRADAQKKAEEEQHLKLIEKDKQLEGALKEVEDMRRKLQQGSQQMQGEAFELEFEEALRRQYPNDVVEEVGKGIKGGDVIQEVIDGNGNSAGKILWELKNTKTWQEGWIDKLKKDKRAINAEEAILITEVLPNDTKQGGYRNGIWVIERDIFITVADTMRAKLIQMYYLKNASKGKDAKMEILYQYLSGVEFKNRVEAIIEAFTNMQTEIEKEKRYFSSKWARDEKNIRQVVDNTYGMHGDLKGIVGRVLPEIKGLDFSDESPLLLSNENT